MNCPKKKESPKGNTIQLTKLNDTTYAAIGTSIYTSRIANVTKRMIVNPSAVLACAFIVSTSTKGLRHHRNIAELQETSSE